MRSLISALVIAYATSVALPVSAATTEFTLIMKNHAFQPSELVLPAGEKIKLVIKNQDANAEEFESKPLKREKVIPGNSTGIVFVGPLKPGTYDFVGEYHEDDMKGKIIVK